MIDQTNFIKKIFLISLSLHLVIGSLIPISLSADSYQYLRLAFTPFNVSDWDNRPFGYPLLLKILLFNSKFGLSFIIFFQIISSALIPVVIYLTLRKYDDRISKILSFIMIFYPYYNMMSYQIMTESFYFLSISLIIYSIDKFINQQNYKNLFFALISILISCYLRPSGQLLFYILPVITFISMLINQKLKKKIIFFFICLILSLSLKIVYTSTLPEWGKSFGQFIVFYRLNSKLCTIENDNEIESIIQKNEILLPDKENIYMNLSNLNEIKNLNKYYSQYYDLDQRLFSKKCVNRNNGKFSNEYFKIVDELLSKDLFLKKQLTHFYDIKLSPTENLNPKFKNLNNSQITDKVHSDVILVQPFIYIYFSMARNLGFKETRKITNNLIKEYYGNFNNNVLFKEIRQTLNYINPIYVLNQNETVFSSGRKLIHDANFWRFLIRPYETIEKQNSLYLYGIPHEIFIQNVYSLEKLNGKETLEIVYQNDQNNLFTTIESKFGLDVESAPEHRQKNINYLKYIVDNLNIKNIANVTLLTLSFLQSIFDFIFKNIFIFIIPTISLVILILSKFNLKIKSFLKDYKNLAIISVSLYITGAMIYFISNFIFFNLRHFTHVNILFVPILYFNSIFIYNFLKKIE